MKSAEAVSDLIRLIAGSATVRHASAADKSFQKWLQDALVVLRAGLGEQDTRTLALLDIKFSVPPALLIAVRREAPEMSNHGRTVPIPIDEATARHFQNAMTEAVGILHSAKAALESA